MKFDNSLESLAGLFGREIKTALVDEYFKALSRFENWQVDRVFEQAKLECSSWPRIVTLLRIAEGLGYIHTVSRVGEYVERWISVECICEEHWSVDRTEIERNPEAVYRCKNPECRASFPGRAILAREYKGFSAFSKFWQSVFEGHR